jgi:hypothetical protein
LCPRLVEGLAEGKVVVRLVAAWAFDGRDFTELERLIGRIFGVAFGSRENVGLGVRHEIGRVGRRDV